MISYQIYSTQHANPSLGPFVMTLSHQTLRLDSLNRLQAFCWRLCHLDLQGIRQRRRKGSKGEDSGRKDNGNE
jgi:hypothetical protein